MFNLVDFDGYLIQAITSTPWYKKHYDADTSPDEVDYIEGMVQILAWYINWLEDFRKEFGEPELFISEKKDGKYHRHLLYPDYKKNRSKYKNSVAVWRRISESFKILMQTGIMGVPVHVLSGYEADDTVSVVADYIKKQDPRVRINIHSIDKDLQTVPDTIMYSPTNPEGMHIDRQVMEESVRYQMVVGDSTDGYSGLKGHGKKKYEDYWSELSNKQFKQEYVSLSSPEYFKLIQDLVRMLNLKSAKRLMPRKDYTTMINICEVIYGRCKKAKK